MANQNQRSLERKNLIYYLKVFDQSTGNLMGRLADLTQNGLMLLSEEPIPTKKNFKMRLVLMPQMGGKGQIVFEAQSRWCRKDVNPDLFDTGFEFVEILQTEKNRVENLISDYFLPG